MIIYNKNPKDYAIAIRIKTHKSATLSIETNSKTKNIKHNPRSKISPNLLIKGQYRHHIISRDEFHRVQFLEP